MKKSLLPLVSFLIFCSSIGSLSAQTLKDVFASSETSILYLGIDFTQARMIGDESKQGIEIRDIYFPGINDLVINEPKKYDLQKAFNKTTINNDLSIVEKRNKTINAEDIISDRMNDYVRLREADINKLVSGIDFEGRKGLGLLFIMDGMKKTDKYPTSSIWVTIVDMGNNKVFNTYQLESKSKGVINFRKFLGNY